MTQAPVSLRDVHFQIDSKLILQGLTLDVAAGETLVLLGRSGSGKTTALKLINGLLFPARGEVFVDGKPTTAWDPVRLKRRIGYVIQESGLFPHFTVAANVGLVPRLESRPPDAINKRVDELLARVGLDPALFRSRYPRELSGGQRQRVGVARALAADPPILLFDEPFGAVDPVTRSELQREYLAWAFGKSSLFVTHDVRESLKVASRIALLDAGKLDFLGTPDEFLNSRSRQVEAFKKALS